MLFLGGAQAYRTGPPVADIGMNDQLQLFLSVEAPVDIIGSGDSLPFRVVVADQHGNPVAGASVAARVEGDAVLNPTEGTTDAMGRVAFEFTASSHGDRQFTLAFEADYPDAVKDAASLEVTVFSPPEPAPVPHDIQYLTVGLAAIGLAALAGSEVGRCGLFNALVFPLYTRMKREEVLDHFVRGQIYGHILSNPGEHYTAIRDRLKVTNGTLSHHLRTLEVQGYVRSRREGTRKRFYPINMVLPRDRGIRLSDLQIKIVERVEEGDGPTQKDIAADVGTSQQAVSYNLRTLLRAEKVRVEREGRIRRYFPSDE